jgi:hypothetical protein
VSHSLFACDLFLTSLSDSFIFLTLTRLVVVLKFLNFIFALFTPPLGDFHLGFKKQNSVALSTTEAEYIVAGHCCAQLLWMSQTLRDYGYKFCKVPLLCDNESAIRMADNPVEHSHTKHIVIRYHFLRDHQQRGISRFLMLAPKNN